ncbi:CobW family GTP-binding protein [Modicisalibacter muralis]|nr:GTP-binding protein [Halomonas muralis]
MAIPTTLLCGFLGSGKTTRINRMIGDGALKNALFLVNDFGSINIDAELIESREDSILRLNNGCACCGIAGNFSAQLRDIKRWEQRPEQLVFEASGIARPRPLMQLFDAAQGYALNVAESLIDASAFERHYRDPAIDDIFIAQIREVTRLRINRLNWLSAAQRDLITREIIAINPQATLIFEENFEESPGEPPPPMPAMNRTASGPLASRSVTLPRPIDVAALDALLASTATELVRAKGTVTANDTARTRYLVQFAGGRATRVATTAGKTQALVVIGHQGEALSAFIDALDAL